MNLPVPVVGVDPGPDWALNINSCLTILDSHDHSSGKGVAITPNGLNINSTLTVNSNDVIDLRSVRFSPQTSVAGAADLGCLYVSGVDLYYNDENGNSIRITQSGGVAGTPGSIANLVAPASASYVGGNSTFVWQSGVNIAANMDMRSAILRNSTASSSGLTLSCPSTISSDYTITLPFLPVTQSIMTIDSSGNIATPGVYPLTLASLASSLIEFLVPSGSIISYGGTSSPSGFLICDGTSYLRSNYPTLFAIIGTAFGAADSTHFNVPDFRGQFLRGVTGASSNDPDASSRTAMNTGGNTGNNVGSIQSDEFQSHNHGGGDHIHNISYRTSTVGPLTPVIGGFANNPGTYPTNSSGTIISTQGGNETRPINAYVNFIIKT
jgi:hypothetical protein